jgi:hypothetical protein
MKVHDAASDMAVVNLVIIGVEQPAEKVGDCAPLAIFYTCIC